MITFLFKACVATFLLAVLLGIVAVSVTCGFLMYQSYKEWKEDLVG